MKRKSPKNKTSAEKIVRALLGCASAGDLVRLRKHLAEAPLDQSAIRAQLDAIAWLLAKKCRRKKA